MPNDKIYCENCRSELIDESERIERLHERCKPNLDELLKLMKFANDIRPLLEFEPFEEIGISDLRESEYGPGFMTENGIVTFFSYRHSQEKEIPVSFYQFTGLKKLELVDCTPADQFKALHKLTELEEIYFSEILFKEIPNSLTQLKKLKKLILNENEFYKIGDSIGQLHQLEYLELNHNELELTTLPDSIGQLHQLKYLDLSYNNLTDLPESIGQLQYLEFLDLTYNKLTSLPESIGKLKNLKDLIIGENQLSVIPESIGELTELETLTLGGNRLTVLPESFRKLKKLKYFDP